MSFEKMRVEELKDVCEYFGVDLGKNKADTLKNLEEVGVTWDQWVKFQKMEEESKNDSDDVFDEAKSELEASQKFTEKEQNVILKLVSKNFSFQVLGYNFSQKNPFVVLSAKKAQQIIDFYPDSFRIATPREAEQFYS